MSRWFTHLIISRVNVRWRPEHKDAEWVAARVALLNKCLRPSLAQQTCQDFRLVTLWGGVPVEGGELPGEEKFIVEHSGQPYTDLARRLCADTGVALITRVDSDDCLRDDFVERLQAVVDVSKGAPRFYDVGRMFLLETATGKVAERDIDLWYRGPGRTSAFTSCLETDIFCRPYRVQKGHTRIAQYMPGEWVDGLEVLVTVHGANIATRFAGDPARIDVKRFSPRLGGGNES